MMSMPVPVIYVLLLVVSASCADVPQRIKNGLPVHYSNSWALELSGEETSANAEKIAQKYGFRNLGLIGNLNDVYHFQLVVDSTTNLTTGGYKTTKQLAGSLAEMEDTPQLTTQLEQEENVVMVEQQMVKVHDKKDYTAPTDPNWRDQWSLVNTGQTRGPSGLDLNVEPAWMQDITGTGVVVGFVDDGLERTHPDLAENYDSYASWDFVHYDLDPTPDQYFGDEPDSHGTSCAGEVGMEKGNGNCGVGVAYNSHIAGLKFDVSASSDVTEASALGHYDDYIDVYSNSWGPSDFGFVVDGPGTLLARALQTGASEGRGGKGSIFVWAAGNGGQYYDSCTADGYSSSIYTIAVGSADQNGGQAAYDEQCSAKIVVTFSYNSRTFPQSTSTWDPYDQITTTTLNGRCTDDFTGTSASTPLMSGVIALTLQANPDLTWRDVQYLLAYTSNRDILSGGEWITNGAGLKVSHKFGFGAVDAEAMVTRAKRWTNVPAQQSHSVYGSRSSGTARNYSPLTITFDVSSSSSGGITFLEHVVVAMTLRLGGYSRGYDLDDFTDEIYQITSIDELYDWLEAPHTRRGDIKIELTSPDSTKSVLLPYRNYDFINEEGYDNWPFMSVHHWGENPVGRWTLKISFKSSSGYVSVSGVRMTLHGTTATPQSVSNIPSHCNSACARSCSGTGADNCDACSDLRVAETLECVNHCPLGTHLYKNYCLGHVVPTTDPPTSHTSPPLSTHPSIGDTTTYNHFTTHSTHSTNTPSQTSTSTSTMSLPTHVTGTLNHTPRPTTHITSSSPPTTNTISRSRSSTSTPSMPYPTPSQTTSTSTPTMPHASPNTQTLDDTTSSTNTQPSTGSPHTSPITDTPPYDHTTTVMPGNASRGPTSDATGSPTDDLVTRPSKIGNSNTGAVAGGIVTAAIVILAGFAALAVVIVFCHRKKRPPHTQGFTLIAMNDDPPDHISV